MPATNQEATTQARWELIAEIERVTDKPLLALSFLWLALVLIDLQRGLSPTWEMISFFIWMLFVLDFLMELLIAPHKGEYLKRNWLTGIALVLPALRMLGIFRAFHPLRYLPLGRHLSLLRLLTSVRGSIRSLGLTLQRRGFVYVVLMTLVVVLAGAGGMAYFESPQALSHAGVRDTTGLTSYWDALWWTAMVLTTMGSQYWPVTVEGRILGWLIAVYSTIVYGYITATLASHFIRIDTQREK